MRTDHSIILNWVKSGARVLDLGCGDGTLLKLLADQKAVHGYGLEISEQGIQACVEKGVNVVEQDLDEGLGNFDDDSFDVVIMSQTIQTMHYPDRVLSEMLRVGREGVVAFPNFGHWKARWYLAMRGRMPVSDLMPYEWYNTPNIHFCTFRDFEALCQEMNLGVLERRVVAHKPAGRILGRLRPNLFGETGIYRVSK